MTVLFSKLQNLNGHVNEKSFFIYIFGPSHINKHDYFGFSNKLYTKAHQKEDKLHAHQCLAHDMVLRHPMSWYKHGQLQLPSSQAGMRLNQHRYHHSMLRKNQKSAALGWPTNLSMWTTLLHSKINSGCWMWENYRSHNCGYTAIHKRINSCNFALHTPFFCPFFLDMLCFTYVM